MHETGHGGEGAPMPRSNHHLPGAQAAACCVYVPCGTRAHCPPAARSDAQRPLYAPAAHALCGWSCACSSPSGGATSLRSSSNAASTDRLAPCAACVARCSDAVLARSCKSAFSAQRKRKKACVSTTPKAPRRGTAHSAPFLARALFSDLRSNESMRAPAQRRSGGVNPARRAFRRHSLAQAVFVGGCAPSLSWFCDTGTRRTATGGPTAKGARGEPPLPRLRRPSAQRASSRVSAAGQCNGRHARRARPVRLRVRNATQRSGARRAHREACSPRTALRCRPRAAPRCTRSPAHAGAASVSALAVHGRCARSVRASSSSPSTTAPAGAAYMAHARLRSSHARLSSARDQRGGARANGAGLTMRWPTTGAPRVVRRRLFRRAPSLVAAVAEPLAPRATRRVLAAFPRNLLLTGVLRCSARRRARRAAFARPPRAAHASCTCAPAWSLCSPDAPLQGLIKARPLSRRADTPSLRRRSVVAMAVTLASILEKITSSDKGARCCAVSLAALLRSFAG